ncbi:MAG: undecaprenyl-diphosphate phosphatase [SAR202 cluster bacterium]|nr:undecaprenyl-diphosphate phosphatase [SAR202 cluster bacterium]
MNILEAIVLSIVEGLTEFIPVSSTGHLVLTADLLGISQTNFVKSFEIAIQLGAILAIVILYWNKLLLDKQVMARVAAAFLPTAIIGLLLYNFIKGVLLGNTLITLAALLVGGIALIAIELMHKEQADHTSEIEELSYPKAFLIGLIQAISVIPGISRSGASIIGGLLLGMKRRPSAEFSFLLAVPTMVAATGFDLFQTGFAFSGREFLLLAIGFVGAFATALLAVKFFLRYISSHSFVAFGIYRIILAVLFWALIIR